MRRISTSLNSQTAEGLAVTINALKGQATILYIAHVVPRGLKPDEAMRIASQTT
jgi:hypothetical protein